MLGIQIFNALEAMFWLLLALLTGACFGFCVSLAGC
jgi:hypothetical protein